MLKLGDKTLELLTVTAFVGLSASLYLESVPVVIDVQADDAHNCMLSGPQYAAVPQETKSARGAVNVCAPLARTILNFGVKPPTVVLAEAYDGKGSLAVTKGAPIHVNAT